MGICWYCYWGWSKPVADIYHEALRRLDGYDSPLLFGPTHVVWEDENWDLVQSCLDDFEKYKGDYTDDELAVVKWSLEELLKIPMDIRDPEPEDYDDEHPEMYPPPYGIKMEHR